MDLALPQEMINGVEQFKEFYEFTTKHRKLGWVYALGTCHVKANFDAKPIELILGTFQATLLLLFNTGNMMSPATDEHDLLYIHLIQQCQQSIVPLSELSID